MAKRLLVTGRSHGFGRAWAQAALEGFSEAPAHEVGTSGIDVTIVEPGGVRHRLGVQRCLLRRRDRQVRRDRLEVWADWQSVSRSAG